MLHLVYSGFLPVVATQSGVLIGQLGQAHEWDIGDKSTWVTTQSAGEI